MLVKLGILNTGYGFTFKQKHRIEKKDHRIGSKERRIERKDRRIGRKDRKIGKNSPKIVRAKGFELIKKSKTKINNKLAVYRGTKLHIWFS